MINEDCRATEFYLGFGARPQPWVVAGVPFGSGTPGRDRPDRLPCVAAVETSRNGFWRKTNVFLSKE